MKNCIQCVACLFRFLISGKDWAVIDGITHCSLNSLIKPQNCRLLSTIQFLILLLLHIVHNTHITQSTQSTHST